MINPVSSSLPMMSPLVNQPVGRQAVGQESTDLKLSSFRPTEQLAESGQQQNRRLPGDNPSQDAEEARLADNQKSRDVYEEQQVRKQRVQKEQQEAEQKLIEQLAARDREVRAHEQAHAAAGGQYAGSPTYTYQRGPDGVSYAVGGEVSIDTSPIPNDPEATLRKAELIARAANAPAEPSGQDRVVAAQAATMAQQARVEINRQQQEKQKDKVERVESSADTGKLSGQEKIDKPQDNEKTLKAQKEAEAQAEQQQRFAEIQQKNIKINRRLLEINNFERATSVGRLLDRQV